MNWHFLLLLLLPALSGCNFELFPPKRDPFYSAILQADQNNPAALFAQGRLLLNQGKYKEAEALFTRLVAIDADNHAAWSALGRTRLELGRFKPAETAFRRQIELKDSSEAQLGLAAALLMQGQSEQAQQIAEQIAAKYGDSAGLSRLRGDIAFRQQDYPTALNQYELSLQHNPNQPGLTSRISDLRDFTQK